MIWEEKSLFIFPIIAFSALLCVIITSAIRIADPPRTIFVTSTPEGCKLYAYKADGESPVYFTTCEGSTQQSVLSGKVTIQNRVSTSVKR